MIRQYDAQKICDDKLREHGLYSKGWRTCFTKADNFLARCYYDEKRIQINVIMLQSVSEADYMQTVLHEIAHALIGPGFGHGPEWINKAKEIGLSDPVACIKGNFSIDKGRSLKPTEVKEKRVFHRLDKQCPQCGKKAEEIASAMLGGARWTKLKCGHLVKADTIKSEGIDISNWTSNSGKKIYPYQVEGIKFLEQSGGRALIADEPGLGKTIQAQGFIYAHKELVTPCLWVCKSTLKLQALKEALDWCGPEFMGQIIYNPRSFIMPNLKLYVISMDLLRNMPTEKLDKIGFKTVVADEIQHFKNPDSTRTAELRKLVAKADYFIPLSGTPWKNRGQEYFPVLNMLDPIRFPSYENFKNRWVDYYLDERTGKFKQGGIRDIPKFREYTKDLVIRRMRDDVLPDLPKIQREIRWIEMEELAKKAYDKAEEHVADVLKGMMIDDTLNYGKIQGELMKLKHLAGLAKCEVAIEDAIQFLEQTDDSAKLTIFHHHIDVGDNIQDGNAAKTYDGLNKWLVDNGYSKCLRLYGGRSPEERDEVIDKFKRDKNCRVLIASTLASGEGLNIQFCQGVMQVERQWNPQNEEQAELRFSRPLTWGDYPRYLQEFLFNIETKQPKKTNIRVPYLIADGTLDSMLTEIVERKRTNFRKSMNVKDENLEWSENEIIAELAELIIKKRFGRKSA